MTDQGSAKGNAPASVPAPRFRLRKIVRVVSLVLLVLVLLLGLLIAFPPIGLFKDAIANWIGSSIGRTVTIGGAHLKFRPDAILTLENVAVSNPPAMPGADFFRAESIVARASIWPLLKGETDVLALDIAKPEINLAEDGSGQKNWVFTGASGASGPPLVLPRRGSVSGGRMAYTSARTGADVALGAVDAQLAVAPETGVTEVKGEVGLNGDRVSAGMALADYRVLAAGKPTTVRAALEASNLRAEVAGEAVISDKSAFAGDLKASTASLLALLGWLGADIGQGPAPLPASLEGRIKATPSDVLFAATSLNIDGNMSRIDGRLALAGPRPKFEGMIAADRLDLARLAGARTGVAAQSIAPRSAPSEVSVPAAWDDLLLELKALEGGGASRLAPQPALSAAPAQPPWSDRPFRLSALKAFDLDVILTVAEAAYAGLDLKNGRIKAALADGRLDSAIEELDLGAGQVTGTIKVDSRAEPPRADIALALANVAAEPVADALSGMPLLSGTSDVDITASAAGQTQAQLAQTLEGKAKFKVGPGALRGFDIRLILSQWWRKWTFDLARKTSFERLDAHYDIRKGVLTSAPEFALTGPEVEISSKGAISLPAKSLNQEIRIKVVPPPTAFPIPVRITGAWSEPAIGVDWAGLFSSTGGLGGPQGIAPSAEPAPLAVQAAIRRVLAAGVAPGMLTEEGRMILQSLLPEAGAPTSPSDIPATPQ